MSVCLLQCGSYALSNLISPPNYNQTERLRFGKEEQQNVCAPTFEKKPRALGFDKPTENSIDGVSDRDYVLELAAALSILMMHLSRFSEEIILWASYEFGFIALDDAYATAVDTI